MPEEPITFPKLVAARTAEEPDAVCIDSVESGPHTWSQLSDRGRRLAGGLTHLGVRPGEPVLTMLLSDFDGVAAWDACARVGAVETPVNHAYRGAWLRGIADRIGARVAMVEGRFWPSWEAVLEGSPIEQVVVMGRMERWSVGSVEVIGSEDLLEEARELSPDHDQSTPDDLALIMHTSGTTGASKGVMLPWTALEFRCNQKYTPTIRRSRSTVSYVPFGPFHWTGRGRWYEMALIGCRIVTRHEFKTDAWLPDIRRHGCTTTALVGAMPRFVMTSPERPDDEDNPLELVQMGPVLPNVDAFKRRFGVPEVTAAYAMTEIPYAFVTREPHFVTNETSRSCGIRDLTVPVQVVRPDGTPVEAGEVGELLVGGDRRHVNRGYYNMPEESAKAWEGEWFHTGDLFRFDEEGRYYFVDRAKDALRRRGENISSMEIEAMVNAHPAVAESAVIGVPSEWGEDEVKVFVVVNPGQELEPEDLIEFIRPHIAEFAVPRFVEPIDALPKTATQRVQKVLLRERGHSAATWDRTPNPRVRAATTDARS